MAEDDGGTTGVLRESAPKGEVDEDAPPPNFASTPAAIPLAAPPLLVVSEEAALGPGAVSACNAAHVLEPALLEHAACAEPSAAASDVGPTSVL